MGADSETLNQWAPAPALVDEWTPCGNGAQKWTSPCGRVKVFVWFNTHGNDWRYSVDSPGLPAETVGVWALNEAHAKDSALKDARDRLAQLGAKPAPDLINHPAHYTSSPYESIVVIESVGSGFCRGNALKYLCRAPHKGSEAADLRKAAWYVRRLVTSREAFEPMGRKAAEAVAFSWAEHRSVRCDAILSLLTGMNHMMSEAEEFDAALIADALEAVAGNL